MQSYLLPSFNAFDLTEGPIPPTIDQSGAESAKSLLNAAPGVHPGSPQSRCSISAQTEANRVRSAVLHREAFKTSRLLEFCSKKELIAQTGHQVQDWPLVIVKELVDNGIDDAEEREIAPEISVKVSNDTGEVSVADNGSGIQAATIDGMLDYSARISSREAYVSPTRGAQGNALKALISMPFALTGDRGETLIEARGIAHRIVFDVDHLRQQPRITHECSPSSVKNGTRVTIAWPHSASSILKEAETDFLQIAENFAWLNPHLAIRVEWDGRCVVERLPSEPRWQKWRACDPTSAHWYDLPRFERYIAAHVSRNQDLGRDRTVREFRICRTGSGYRARSAPAVAARLGMPNTSILSTATACTLQTSTA